MKLLLFDIDGTLVNTNGAGRRAIDGAFAHIYGRRTILDGLSLAGRTDVTIMMDVYARAGIDFSFDELERVKPVYFAKLAEELQNGGTKRMMPGIAELVPRLHEDEHICLALLTGNWQKSGRMKIDYFGLNDYFPFGAFADDAVERADLVPVAIQRFQDSFGFKPAPRDVYIIGDTPSDILCAKPHGVVSIAVAAAAHSMYELQKYEPDILLENLQDTTQFMNVLKMS